MRRAGGSCKPVSGGPLCRCMFSLSGKAAVVTGGGSGIGEAICACFAVAGATVCVLDRDSVGGKKVAEAIRSRGGRALFVECDVSREASCEEGARTILAE